MIVLVGTEVANDHVDPRFDPTLVGLNMGLTRKFPTSTGSGRASNSLEVLDTTSVNDNSL